jgi:hypothetical protein
MRGSKLISRRQFGVLGVGVAAAAGCSFAFPAPAAGVTAQQVFDRVREKAAPDWSLAPPTGLIAGSPDTAVRGVVTTPEATVDVIRQAAKSGANLIFTCEPTFFSRADGRKLPGPGGGGGRGPQEISAADPVLAAKKALVEQNGLVIYRVADKWTGSEDRSLALAEAMGWAKGRSADDPLIYTFSGGEFGKVLAEMKQKLAIRGGMRVIGDNSWKMQSVAILTGLHPLADLVKYLPKADMVIVGESRDWEGPEYFVDAKAAGMKKGYAQIGRVVSEDPGMLAFSKWMRGFVTEVPVQSIPATDPYWRPANDRA